LDDDFPGAQAGSEPGDVQADISSAHEQDRFAGEIQV
jgi:hypothetical protein